MSHCLFLALVRGRFVIDSCAAKITSLWQSLAKAEAKWGWGEVKLYRDLTLTLFLPSLGRGDCSNSFVIV